VLPAIASSETSATIEAVNTTTGSGIYSEEHHSWRPAQVSVMAGGVVPFSNPTAVRHGIKWINPPAQPVCDSKVPVGTTEAVAGTNWSGTCTFSQPGTYTFYCTVHGPEMTGTITVNANGTTTTTTTAPPTTTATTTPPPPQPEESPLIGPASQALKLAKSQHGGTVHGSIAVSQAGAGGRLEVDLLARGASLTKTKHGAPVRVGRLVRSSLSAGKVSFSVRLSARARRALKRHRRLTLTARVILTPASGKVLTVTRVVVEHV
jgi:plastocyanin